MESENTVFAILTYRLRDVAEAIEAHDANFWRNGHAVKLMVFDDPRLELWPTLVGVCYYYKDKRLLPQIKVKNKRLETHR